MFLGWYPLETKLENAVLSDIQIHAMRNNMRFARVEMYFASGSVNVSSGPHYEQQSLEGKYLTIRAGIKTSRIPVHGKVLYSLHLEIQDDNAVMTFGDNNMGIAFPELNDVMRETFERSLTSILKSVMEKGTRYQLMEFDLPIPTSPGNISIIRELVPKDIDPVFYFDERNSKYNSFGVLMSPPELHVAENKETRMFGRHQLVPSDADFAIQIDGQAVMSFIDTKISELEIFGKIRNPLYVTNTCPSQVVYYDNEAVQIEGMTLKQFKVKQHNREELEIYAELLKEEASPGVDLQAWAVVRFAIEYDSKRNTFVPRITYAHQSHRLIKAWYTQILSTISFGWYHVIVDVLMGEIIDDKILKALEVSIRGSDMPSNIGGIVGEAVERMHFADSYISNHGNFVFKLNGSV